MNPASPVADISAATPTTSDIVDVTATVDDVELLNILGLTSNTTTNPISCNDLAVLDWDDMPELSAEEDDEEEEDDDKESISSKNNKRKYNDQDEDIFADLDFVEVPLIPATAKKQKTFVDEEDESELLSLNMDLLPPLDDEIRLALDLISSS